MSVSQTRKYLLTLQISSNCKQRTFLRRFIFMCTIKRYYLCLNISAKSDNCFPKPVEQVYTSFSVLLANCAS